MDKQQPVKSVSLRVLSITMVSAIIIVLWIHFIFPMVIVSGVSMMPTYTSGDFLFSTRNFTIDSLQRDDVIVFQHQGKKKLIKRVIGLPGETVSVKTTGIYINGIKYEGAFPDPAIPSGKETEFTLLPDEFYVLGDNRGASLDSRSFGPIRFDNITAKVTRPFRLFNNLKNKLERGNGYVQ